MTSDTQDITVRSIANETRDRLDALKSYTRLSFGSLLDDAVYTLWEEYLAEGHDLPQPVSSDAAK